MQNLSWFNFHFFLFSIEEQNEIKMISRQTAQGKSRRSKGWRWVIRSWTTRNWLSETKSPVQIMWTLLFLGGYSVNGGSGENTYGRKSLGQELRVNNVTSPEFTSVQHGSRALAIKDMRKSQGKVLQTGDQSQMPSRRPVTPIFLDASEVGWFTLWVEKHVQVIIFCIPFPVNCFLE